MAEKARSFKNWFGNTIRIPQRTVGTVGLLGADAIKTTVGVVEDFGDITTHYTDEIVSLFSKDKKWYQKALNVPVAIGKTLVGAVEAAVKPVVNGVVNTGKTALNATTNAWKSTLGSLFSAKPVSDISFNTIKTKKKGVISVDTAKRTLDPNKTWTSNRGKRSKSATGVAAATTAAAAATAAAEKKMDSLQKSFDEKMKEMQNKMDEMKNKFDKQLQEVLTSKKELEDKNKSLSEANTQKDGEIAKLKAELQGLKKDNEKRTEVKPIGEPEVKSEPKPEKKEGKIVEMKPEKKEGQSDGKKDEKKDENKEEKKSEGKEGKGADRLSEYVGSNKGKSVVNYLKRSHPDMVVNFNNSNDTGHIHLGDSSEELKIGTKNVEEIPTIILHEGAHALIHDDVEGIGNLVDYVNDLNKRYGKQLFSLSNNKKYDTRDKKRDEDVCELIALYARDDGSFDKHMKNLQGGKNEKLAKISDSEVEELRDLCETVISGLNTVKMYDDVPLRKIA